MSDHAKKGGSLKGTAPGRPTCRVGVTAVRLQAFTGTFRSIDAADAGTPVVGR